MPLTCWFFGEVQALVPALRRSDTPAASGATTGSCPYIPHHKEVETKNLYVRGVVSSPAFLSSCRTGSGIGDHYEFCLKSVDGVYRVRQPCCRTAYVYPTYL